MLFNSIDFVVFLPIVFALYWWGCRQRLQLQNILLAVASYIFYAWWDWRFLTLIFLSTLVDYTVGLQLAKTASPASRKILLGVSLIFNLGVLAFFKYSNFFIENFAAAFTLLGKPLALPSLQLILPVGISFYTFQTLSYTIDVYRRKIEPTKDFVAFGAFVSFFPQLVAGPIERATNLLPQFFEQRQFSYHQAVQGLRQILWGLFKKVVIADNCAVLVDHVFDDPSLQSGSTLLIGAVFFAFQIYGDFSGYSDIAIGTARLFGFRLMQNFAFPYFSRDIAEFWRRWHISLSTWFRDYLYIPLGGSRVSIAKTIRNVFVIFLVSGFWHGANWTFLFWGFLHACYFLPLLMRQRNRSHLDVVAARQWWPSLKETLQMLSTFTLTVLAWIFFRAVSLEAAFNYLSGIFSSSLLTLPDLSSLLIQPVLLCSLLLIMLSVEWLGRSQTFALALLEKALAMPLRWAFYLLLALLILALGGPEQEFIYFQF